MITVCGKRAVGLHFRTADSDLAALFAGAAEFLRFRDVDALGTEPHQAFVASARACAEAFAAPGALDRTLDHPLGQLVGRQALAVRTTDTVIHTWDLARALGGDDTLDTNLVAWIDAHLHEIYGGMAESPVAERTTHRFFGKPVGDVAADSSTQDQLLHTFGRPLLWTAG